MREQYQSGATTKAIQSSPVSHGPLPRFYLSLEPISRVGPSQFFGKCLVRRSSAATGTSFQSETSVTRSIFATIAHATQCIFGSSFARGTSFHLRCIFVYPAKINRHTGKIETLVSRSKQRTGTPINRHISRDSYLPFFTFYSLFSGPILAPSGLGGNS
jgi:hypothetical protein